MNVSFFERNINNKTLSIAQKVIIFGALFSAIFVFVYSFILMTPFTDLYQLDGGFLFTRMKQFGILPAHLEGLVDDAYFYSPVTGKKIGVNLAYFTSFTRNELQVFNHWIFALGFFGIIVSIIPIIYMSHKRKIYYKTNYIVIPAASTFNLYVGIHMLVQLIMNQTLVASKANNFTLLNAYQTYINDTDATTIIEHFKASDSNWVFAIGYIIAISVILFAIFGYVLTYVKYKYQKKQPVIDLSKVSINE